MARWPAATGEIVPRFVSAIARADRQVRTLVLSIVAAAAMSYLLLRGESPQFSDAGLAAEPAAQSALNARWLRWWPRTAARRQTRASCSPGSISASC